MPVNKLSSYQLDFNNLIWNAYLLQASVSIKRLGKFLKNADIDMNSVQHNPNAGTVKHG